MSNLVFWQTVGAVITGNTLMGLTGYMIWRHTKWERGQMGKAPFWIYPAGVAAPLIAAFAAYMLPR